MGRKHDVMQSLLLREFLLEPRLADEEKGAEFLETIGKFAAEHGARRLDEFLERRLGTGLPSGVTKELLLELTKRKHATWLTRMTSDLLASFKSPEEKYASCCRSALCHAVVGASSNAFGALRVAASVNDDWARHHHVYGLIHGADGQLDRSLFELRRALAAEPFPQPRGRIAEAISVAETL